MNILRICAVLNVVGLVGSAMGGLFLFYSLTFEPSHFRLVKVGDKKLAMCLDDKVVQAGYGGPLVATDEPCPNMQHIGPTLQVIANRPSLATWGIWLVVAGFFLQLPAASLVVWSAKQ
jgi:hypothetical protein